MNSKKSSKINQLLRSWPRGTIAVSSWLKQLGISSQLADIYCKSQWIERIGSGAFKLFGDDVDWTGAIKVERIRFKNSKQSKPEKKSEQL